MLMPAPDLIARLPHRPPFRFLTTVESLEPGIRAAGTWRITGDEDFFRGHFPSRPLVPGVLIGEALAQLSGLVGARGGDQTSGSKPAHAYLAHVDIKFTAPVEPPADITLSSIQGRSMGPLTTYAVRAEVRGEVVATGSLILSTKAGSDTKPRS